MFSFELIVLYIVLLLWFLWFWQFFWSWMMSIFWYKAPYINSFDWQLELLKYHLKINATKSLLDLGCWDWKAMRFFARYYPIQYIDWYDTNIFAVARWRFLNKLSPFSKRLTLMHWDFHNADLMSYDYIYVYLLPHQNELIEDWLFANINDNCIIISNSFQFAKHKPFEKIEEEWSMWKLYLYRKD